MSIQLTTGILQQIKNRGSVGGEFLLDTYTGAAFAYSLRQLKTGVTSVVRVRRSSDNVEADFTALEITNGTLTTWTGANDGFVVTLYDQSGNTSNATQSTTTNQGRLVVAGVLETWMGEPTINTQFGSAQKWLVRSGTITTTGNVLVNVGRMGIGSSGRGFGQYSQILLNSNSGGVNYGGTNNAKAAGTYDTLLTCWSNGVDDGEIRMNGVDEAIAAPISNNVDSTSILSRNATSIGGSLFVSEVIAWGGAQAANVVAIETNINTHYGIY